MTWEYGGMLLDVGPTYSCLGSGAMALVMDPALCEIAYEYGQHLKVLCKRSARSHGVLHVRDGFTVYGTKQESLPCNCMCITSLGWATSNPQGTLERGARTLDGGWTIASALVGGCGAPQHAPSIFIVWYMMLAVQTRAFSPALAGYEGVSCRGTPRTPRNPPHPSRLAFRGHRRHARDRIIVSANTAAPSVVDQSLAALPVAQRVSGLD